jgi:ketosteroid isomerase-like protein
VGNLDLIRDAIGAEGERSDFDPERMRERSERLWDEAIVYEEGPDWPGAGTFEGRDAILARFREYTEVLGEMELKVEELDEVDSDRVFAVLQAFGHSVAGVPTERRWSYVFTIRGEKLVHWKADMDADRARRELGLG